MTDQPSDEAPTTPQPTPAAQPGAGDPPPLDPALLTSRLILAELRTEALRAGMIDADGVRLLDTAVLRLASDATLPDAPALIAGLRAAKPWLFTRSTSSTKAPPAPTPPVPRRATDMTAEEWRQARAELLRHR